MVSRMELWHTRKKMIRISIAEVIRPQPKPKTPLASRISQILFRITGTVPKMPAIREPSRTIFL